MRKVFEETGIKVKVVKKLDAYEFFDDKAPFPNVKTGVHSIAVGFLVTPESGQKSNDIKIDSTSEDFRWADKIEPDFDPYIKKILKDSGVLK